MATKKFKKGIIPEFDPNGSGKKDRIDLEHHIMKCWNVTDDLDMITERLLDSSKFSDLPPHLADKIANILIGMQELYEMRFQMLWDTFEDCIKSREV